MSKRVATSRAAVAEKSSSSPSVRIAAKSSSKKGPASAHLTLSSSSSVSPIVTPPSSSPSSVTDSVSSAAHPLSSDSSSHSSHSSSVASSSVSFKARLRSFFIKDSQQPKALSSSSSTVPTTVSAKPASPIGRIGQHRKELPKAKKVMKVRKKLERRSLQEYFDKAGYDVNADRFKKRMYQFVIVLFLLATLVILTIASIERAKTVDVLVFILGLWTAVFAGGVLLVMACVYFFLDYRIYQRTKEIEEVLPDFLQLASANISAGMPIDKALWYSIRPGFGVLAKEMELVAKATMAGEDLEVSLTKMAQKYDSTVLRRSISILIEGLHAGGEMADLLNKISLNIEEMKVMKKEMAANVTTYAIFITFASVVIAPFLFALATELLVIIIKITGSLDTASSGSFFTMSSPNPEVIDNFRMFSVLMLSVSTIFSACIVSVIQRGNVYDGIKSIPVYALVAIALYYLGSMGLHSVFAGII